MGKIAFTASRVATFNCPPNKSQAFLWDATTPGLGLRNTPKGQAAYVFQGVFGGKDLRITIGSPRAWSIPDAQSKAREYQRLIDQGLDPREQRRQRVAEDAAAKAASLAQAVVGLDVWDEYVKERKPHWGSRHYEDHLSMVKKGGLPSKNHRRQLTVEGPLRGLLQMRLIDLNSEQVPGLIYADVRIRVSAGGTGKTTLALFEAITLALGNELWGQKPPAPIKTVMVTHEDSREILVARMRIILNEMFLDSEEIDQVLNNVQILDVSGTGYRLSRIDEDVVQPHFENIDAMVGDYHGFYLGDASNLDDLVAFWNLRAADLGLLFVDRVHAERYAQQIPAWKSYTAARLTHRRHRDEQKYAIWWRREHMGDAGDMDALRAPFGNEPSTICGVDEHLWNGMNLRPPMMHFDEVASLGVLVTDGDKPKISFGLNDRPYATDSWFCTQHLVASVSFSEGLFGRDDFTLDPPYLPELNEFYARTMHFLYDRLRVESERIGLIVDAAESDSFVYALPTAELFKRIFALAGFTAKVSAGGLIARQMVAQLGGVQGGRVFKIPGARRLLKTHGPTSSFSESAALQLIGGKDDDNVDAKFADYKDLYLEPREPGVSLTPGHVFAYLVGKRLFRIGSDLNCPHCQLRSWFPVDDLRQRVSCHMCGETFDTTNQLIGSKWAYRRSGVLGAERNAQGAVPVVLTLQQLDTNLNHGLQRRSYSVSLDLTPTREQLSKPCEVDFAWLMPRRYPERTIVIIGECKDRGQSPNVGGDGGTINANDIANLRAVADSFPRERFEVYILLAKLCAFTPTEIELARSLNGEHQLRVIMLTDRELEPYHLFERTKKLFKIDQYSTSPADLARATVAIFLDPQPIAPC